MVSRKEERRDYPRYELNELRRLALQGKVNYVSRRVEFDVQALNYSLVELCECLASLTPDHFRESILYPDIGKWLDVYIIDFLGPTGSIDKLYIKLRIIRGAISIALYSFHQEGRF